MGDLELCEVPCVHQELVTKAKIAMQSEERLSSLAEFFKTFGDSTRVRIVSALMAGELCVCDIAECLEMTVSAVSHQLRVLRNTKIVRTRREGKQIFYSIDDEHVEILFKIALEHISHQ